MCGIVGYVGTRPAATVVLDSLERLEYRGYDSAGIATVGDDLYLCKDAGEIADLRTRVDAPDHTTGIGHTRWATHGRPTRDNAHPHTDCDDTWAVVHNGILDDHRRIRSNLQDKGHRFTSETDSEAIAHLLEAHGDAAPGEAAGHVARTLQGSWAVCAATTRHPDRLVAVRRQAPLVVGIGDGERYVASDVPALLPYTDRFIYLEDGDVAVVTADSVEIRDLDGRPVDRPVEQVDWSWEDAEKGGFDHFMHKEIHEAPGAVADTLIGRVRESAGRVDLTGDDVPEDLLDGVERLKLIACGTSYHAALVGKHALEALAEVPTSVEVASEYRYSDLPRDRSLVVALSQSGETADTLGSVREAKRKGFPVLGITNVPGSTLTREADGHLLTRAGPEIGVAATKTFLAQLATLTLLAVRLGRDRATLDASEAQELLAHLKHAPRAIEQVLDREDHIAEHSVLLAGSDHALFIGRHINYPSALEGALKLKEVSYVHAEGYPAGELKHGPFALLDRDTPVVALMPRDATYEKMTGNVGEIKARDAPVLAVAEEGDRDVDSLADAVLRIPPVPPLLTPLPAAVVLQLLAYHTAVKRGCPVDKPRNLAKSVTVE